MPESELAGIHGAGQPSCLQGTGEQPFVTARSIRAAQTGGWLPRAWKWGSSWKRLKGHTPGSCFRNIGLSGPSAALRGRGVPDAHVLIWTASLSGLAPAVPACVALWCLLSQ